ncbi:hypothetical protein Gotri_016780, partial [Gossypium trilobum]|nr:hypothetical protein [Gossypium trilobum]
IRSCFSSSPTPFIFPLKTQILRSPSKLQFQHNVSLIVSLTVGTPPQNVSMVLDTGSELSWVHCNQTTRNNQPDPTIFNPNQSTSYKPIPCFSPTCVNKTQDFPIPPSCDSDNLCHATLSYADASSSDGNLASDTFHLGSSGNISGLVFGCMDSIFSSNADEDSKTTGLMGMNRGSLSFVSQMGFPKFSYCISGSDLSGLLLLGDSNVTWLTPLNYTPLVQISRPVLEDPNFVFQGAMDLCYRVPLGKTRLPNLPSVSLVFTGAEMVVPGDRVLYRVPGETRGNDSVWCLSFGNSDLLGVEAYVIGHHHQQNVWMEFDLEKSRIGLAHVRCDLARQRFGVGL